MYTYIFIYEKKMELYTDITELIYFSSTNIRYKKRKHIRNNLT